MNRNKFFRTLALLLCLLLAIGLIACKDSSKTDDTASDKIETSENVNDGKTQSKDGSSQGIELEEDVFDDSDVQSGAPGDTSSDNDDDTNDTVSEYTETDIDSDVSNGGTSDGDDPTNDTDTAPEQDGDIVVDSDGTVHLPIDKF